MSNKFGLIEDEVYTFDEVYESCPFRKDDADCRCNNGYQCNHHQCGEECEHGIGKCYSFTCPFVTENPSKEDIGKSTLWNIADFEYDEDGFVKEEYEMVIFNGEDIDDPKDNT
jgi:hypothetical protein